MLATGMGGIDWAGLPFVVEHLGIRDVDFFIQQLRVIRGHKPQRAQDE